MSENVNALVEKQAMKEMLRCPPIRTLTSLNRIHIK